MDVIVQKRFEGWKFLHNYDHDYNGRIWFLWKSSLQIDLVFVTDQCIIVYVVAGFGKFVFSCIYGFNTGGERKSFWCYLEGISGLIGDDPLVI